MKRFARCTNCRQWYVHSTTTVVAICLGNGLHRTTLWCLSCIQDTEHRSQSAEAAVATGASVALDDDTNPPAPAVHLDGLFSQLIQAHLDLMDRALHEDSAVLVPLIDEFMQRCRTYQAPPDNPDHGKRLAGHLRYWDTFLQALKRSS